MGIPSKKSAPAADEPCSITIKAQGIVLPTAESAPEPGLVRVFVAGKPRADVLTMGDAPLLLGRTHPLLVDATDPAMSRRHARVDLRGSEFLLSDQGSQNGSELDGQPLTTEQLAAFDSLLRLGESLFLLCRDVRPYQTYGVQQTAGYVTGPAMQRLYAQVAELAAVSTTLYVVGESGAGKESVAQTFHRRGPQHRGPFVAVNCATIAEGVAERLLFGAVRGSYSGATADSDGYLQAANGGTLFLDEVAELELSVQAKLLRVLETREVTRLGASRGQHVDLHLCYATHKDLRAQVAAGKFREDLFFRIAVPQVSLPPLRQRREEIPALVCGAVAAVDPQLTVAAALIQACMLRFWPGNIRELLAVVRATAVLARAAGATVLKAEHLADSAGQALTAAKEPAKESAPGATSSSRVTKAALSREQVEQVVKEHAGNIAAAARALGMHRTQLRRLVARYGV